MMEKTERERAVQLLFFPTFVKLVERAREKNKKKYNDSYSCFF